MEKIEKLLKGLGLSNQAVKVYVALLSLESVSVRKIAEETKINRGTVYETLKQLHARGLVHTKNKGERTQYNAESPDKVIDILNEQRRELTKLSELAQVTVPMLEAMRKQTGQEPLVRFYEHDEGLVLILKDVLATCRRLKKREYHVYSSKPLREYLYRRFPKFTEQRIADNIFVRAIAVGSGGEKALLAERKWIPEADDNASASYTIIYGNKVAMISISEDYTPYGVVIEEPGVADMQRLLFNTLWKSL